MAASIGGNGRFLSVVGCQRPHPTRVRRIEITGKERTVRFASLWINGKLGVMLCGGAIALGTLGGCGIEPHNKEPKGFFDPTAVGHWSTDPLVVPILQDLGTKDEEPNPAFRTATDVKPEDLVAHHTDYAIDRNDLISVSITDLVNTGVETVKTARVSESGNISLPLIGQIHAAGLTEAELERVIVQAYRDANLIQNAQVSVVVQEARARTFSIQGAVAAAGQYQILNTDFRLLDALILARDVTSPTGIDYIYVVRHTDQNQGASTTQPANNQTNPPTTGPSPDVLAPQSKAPSNDLAKALMMDNEPAAAEKTAPPAEAATPAPGEEGGHIAVIDGKPVTVNSPDQATATPAPAATEGTATAANPPSTKQDFEFNELTPPQDVRIIRVPLDPLLHGDLRYNIVVRPRDMIMVPLPTIGEYYMAGHVARVGVYTLTGRKITLKQAVTSAGMFDGLAIPARTEIIRRVGDEKEMFVRVNLDKIFAGEQSDVYLKPNDIVNVGTTAWAPFVAAIRGAFRFTYGFGFLYDRNYAYDDDGRAR
ncbi:MAG: polysaccharide biosynthesis/export family protein [Phycisphaerales bacterium]|jgi:polysaccharide export outer membrane protein|nr:polysaccharide biosynthesis/export family protein [Phycisphaerales bacterium]